MQNQTCPSLFAVTFDRRNIFWKCALNNCLPAWAIVVLLMFTVQAADLSKARLLVTNKGDRTLSIVDPLNNVELAAVAEDGITGHEVVASRDGKRAFVPIYGSSGVGKPGTDGQLLRVIDLAERSVVGTVTFKKGVRPHCARIGPKDGLLYITTELDNSITIIDPVSLKIIGTIPTGQAESHMLVLSSDRCRGYTANVGPGTVSVLDMVKRKLIKIIPISKNTQRISISTDDKWVFTADQTKPQLVVINTSNAEVARRIDLPACAYGTDPTPDGNWLVMALPGTNEVGVLDIKMMTLTHRIKVPSTPQETLVRPDGEVAYVSCDASKQVAVIDLQTWKVRTLISTGTGTDGLAWAQGR